MKQRIIYSLICLLFIMHIQVSEGQELLRERVYIQTDKELYLSGELLWMKLYTTDDTGHLLSLSKVGYVELLGDSIPEIQIKLEIKGGSANGWLEIPATLPTGHYRLTGYTRYMKNEGEDIFFEKVITIINPFAGQVGDSGEGLVFKPVSLLADTSGNVRVSADKAVYSTREKGVISLSGLPADFLTLAVSVAGVDALIVSPVTIENWRQQLDAHRPALFRLKWLPEYEGPIIEGRLAGYRGDENQTLRTVYSLLSFPGEGISLFDGQLEPDGQITFYTNRSLGKHEIATTVVDADDKDYQLEISSPFAPHQPNIQLPLVLDTTWNRFLQKRSVGIQVMAAYMADSLSRIKQQKSIWNEQPYAVYLLDEYKRFPYMEEVFTEFILPARIRKIDGKRILSVLKEDKSGFTTGNSLVLLDNIPVVDHEQIIDYDPKRIKKIEIYLGAYVFGSQLFNGLISFSTYKSDYPGITFKKYTQLHDYEGTQSERLFYVPSDSMLNQSFTPDFRHTLLWNPSLQSGGKSELSVPFITSDLPGTYRVTIEGIGLKGAIVRGCCTISVEE